MNLYTLLIILLILALLGVLPHYNYSQNWGYYPSGGIGFVIVVIIIVLLLG